MITNILELYISVINVITSEGNADEINFGNFIMIDDITCHDICCYLLN